MTKIEVVKKNVYGKDLIYPANHIEALQKLTGAKTLSRRHIEALKELGCEVVVKTEPLY